MTFQKTISIIPHVRIQMCYLEIIFHTSKTMNKGIFFYADSVIPGEVANDVMEIGSNAIGNNNGNDNSSSDMAQASAHVNECSFQNFFSWFWK